MHFSALLFGGLLLSLGGSVKAQCGQFIPVHEIISAPDGVLNIEDEEGARQIKAEVYNTPDCHVNPFQPTGRAFSANYTIIGQMGQNTNSCEIKNVNGVQTMDSFQAIVVQTNGWPLEDVKINFDDIDSSSLSWREAATIFGIRNGALITADFELQTNTVLGRSNYNIPAEATQLLGLNALGAITVPSVEYASPGDINCPFNDSPESRRCRASISFSTAIDTLVIMYAVLARGNLNSRSGAFFSELRTSCGCRCRETNPGTRLITTAAPGVPGQCVRRETSGPKVECDVLGGQWCKKEEMTDYVLTSSVLPNGRFDCEERRSQKLLLESPFVPDPNFGGVN